MGFFSLWILWCWIYVLDINLIDGFYLTILIDGPVLQFENGYLVETVVEGNAIGVVPYSIKVSQDGELFAVDSENSNIVRITPPLSQCMFSSFPSLIAYILWGLFNLLVFDHVCYILCLI